LNVEIRIIDYELKTIKTLSIPPCEMAIAYEKGARGMYYLNY
jgi:hypothetical protein